jgi:hypothetical protein
MEYSVHYDKLNFCDKLCNYPGLYITLSINETGNLFTEDTLSSIVNKLSNNEYNGFIFSGNFLHTSVKESVCDIARSLKALFGDKLLIYLHTEEVNPEDCSDSSLDELLSYADYFVY